MVVEWEKKQQQHWRHKTPYIVYSIYAIELSVANGSKEKESQN